MYYFNLLLSVWYATNLMKQVKQTILVVTIIITVGKEV